MRLVSWAYCRRGARWGARFELDRGRRWSLQLLAQEKSTFAGRSRTQGSLFRFELRGGGWDGRGNVETCTDTILGFLCFWVQVVGHRRFGWKK